MVYPDARVVAAMIARAAPVAAASSHLCQGTTTITQAFRRVLLFPPTDRWGTRRPGDRPAGPGGEHCAHRLERRASGSGVVARPEVSMVAVPSVMVTSAAVSPAMSRYDPAM